MKKVIFLILTLHFSLFTLNGVAQSCLPEGITFITQEQIDSFQVNYPGCTQIEGDVTISGLDIENLNGLNVLNSFDGNLFIHETSLTSLDGLNNITSVGGSLWIGYEDIDIAIGNPLLQSLSGLENLNSVGGDLRISANPLLTYLTGLDSLTFIGGDHLPSSCQTRLSRPQPAFVIEH